MSTRWRMAWWQAAYRRIVRSSFATVPYYRERWALDGRTDPTLVPGRTGTADGACGAVRPAELTRRLVDLAPLNGAEPELFAHRGLGSVLPRLAAGSLVVVLDAGDVRPPGDLPTRVRGCVLDPQTPPLDGGSSALAAIRTTIRRGRPVLVAGSDKQLASLVAALPDEVADQLDLWPVREITKLDGGPYGLLHDQQLGYLGAYRHCGQWHLDWRRVYARSTPVGLAVTLLRQDSPRLVDVLIGGGVRLPVRVCPRHGTPVLGR